MTTTATAATTERKLCLLGLTIGGQSLDIGCIPTGRREAAEQSPTVYCGPKGTGKAFEPLTWSKRDTQKTIDEIREHNAAGRAMKCWK